MITMAIRILYQNEAEKSKSGDNDFFLLTNQICLYVGVALENEIFAYISSSMTAPPKWTILIGQCFHCRSPVRRTGRYGNMSRGRYALVTKGRNLRVHSFEKLHVLASLVLRFDKRWFYLSIKWNIKTIFPFSQNRGYMTSRHSKSYINLACRLGWYMIYNVSTSYNPYFG